MRSISTSVNMSGKLRRWYIPLKSSQGRPGPAAVYLLHLRTGIGLLRHKPIHTTAASHPCMSKENDGIGQRLEGDGTSAPSANLAQSASKSRQRARAEKQRRRREKLDALGAQEGEVESQDARGDQSGSSRLDGRTKKMWRKKEVITYDRPTQPGEKKDVTGPLPASYSPTYVEACWYDWWEKMGFFTPEQQSQWMQTTKPKPEPFVVCLPPPNVTGVLHLGHTLTATIQDSLVRWQRMMGVPSLWIPGCDHAGIAAQVVVEKHLKREKGVTRQDVGREEFIKHVWRWKEEKGGEIYGQLRRLGASLDWERESFTMDEKFSHAVRAAFVRLHDDGVIYRSSQLVNWSCALQSAISDIEVDQLSLPGRTSLTVPGYDAPIEFGTLTYFAYPVENSDVEIPVATTRLETMLGDTGVAVHPCDQRYCHLIGQSVIHPFTGWRLPIIADEQVDREYGTGAVKITPAHDYSDYEMGQRHHLESQTVIDERGNMVGPNHQFQGMRRFDARSAVLDGLKEKGLYRQTKENPMSIPICSRSGDVVEPLLKSQWFVQCSEMGARALRSVETGELQIAPKMYEKTWRNWLTNVRDWCISRQLWWGHRIPAYRVTIDGEEPAHSKDEGIHWVSGQSEVEAREKAVKKFGVNSDRLTLTQDDDVLDTWFSSALFPFAVHGWPNKTEDLAKFYPSTVLETGYDILFFWVARMVMMGQQLTGQLPFQKVYLHSMVRDAHGRKMSKSLGNVIDPLDVIRGISLEELNSRLQNGNMKLDPEELKVAIKGQRSDYPQGIPECGTDALRFALSSYNSQGQDINLNVGQVLEYRHFCNKIWNASKFALTAIGNDFSPLPLQEVMLTASPIDGWILSRFTATVQACQEGFEEVDLPAVTSALYRFWLHNLCDVYLECIKPKLRHPGSPEHTAHTNVLHAVIEGALRLMHPIMPYLTEELFQRLPGQPHSDCPSICVAPYPTSAQYPFRDATVEEQVEVMREVVHAVRSLEGMLGLKKGQSQVGVVCHDEGVRSTLGMLEGPLTTMLHAPGVDITSSGAPPPGSVALAVGSKCTLHISLQGSSSQAARSRLAARCEKAETQLAKVKASMSIRDYEQKVPMKIQDSNQKRVAELEAEIHSLMNLLASLNQSSSQP